MIQLLIDYWLKLLNLFVLIKTEHILFGNNVLKRITSYHLRQKNIFKRTEKSAETWKYPVVHYIYDSFVRLIYSYSNYSFIHLNEINQKKRKIR